MRQVFVLLVSLCLLGAVLSITNEDWQKVIQKAIKAHKEEEVHEIGDADSQSSRALPNREVTYKSGVSAQAGKYNGFEDDVSERVRRKMINRIINEEKWGDDGRDEVYKLFDGEDSGESSSIEFDEEEEEEEEPEENSHSSENSEDDSESSSSEENHIQIGNPAPETPAEEEEEEVNQVNKDDIVPPVSSIPSDQEIRKVQATSKENEKEDEKPAEKPAEKPVAKPRQVARGGNGETSDYDTDGSDSEEQNHLYINAKRNHRLTTSQADDDENIRRAISIDDRIVSDQEMDSTEEEERADARKQADEGRQAKPKENKPEEKVEKADEDEKDEKIAQNKREVTDKQEKDLKDTVSSILNYAHK